MNGEDMQCARGSTWPRSMAKFGALRLALAVPTEADAHRAFDAHADGGTIDMPLNKTFGLVTDRFGLGWMVMVPQAPAD